VLLCDEGVLPMKISKEAPLTLRFDPTLELCTGLRTDVDHALVKLALNSHPFLRRSRRSKRSILHGLYIVDEGKIELGLNVFLECIDPQLWTMARCNDGDGMR
jgi:hypothetical protein